MRARPARGARAEVEATLDRRAADYVVTSFQVGGYRPATVVSSSQRGGGRFRPIGDSVSVTTPWLGIIPVSLTSAGAVPARAAYCSRQPDGDRLLVDGSTTRAFGPCSACATRCRARPQLAAVSSGGRTRRDAGCAGTTTRRVHDFAFDPWICPRPRHAVNPSPARGMLPRQRERHAMAAATSALRTAVMNLTGTSSARCSEDTVTKSRGGSSPRCARDSRGAGVTSSGAAPGRGPRRRARGAGRTPGG